jgi:hypothetical protein
MARFLLIESRDPCEGASVGENFALARKLRGEGHDVALFLVQNGVLPLRSGADDAGLAAAAKAGVEVVADDFSLRERGIAAPLAAGAKAAPIGRVVDDMVAGARVIWH